MYILLFLTVELSSVLFTKIINLKTAINAILNLGEMGFKINKDALPDEPKAIEERTCNKLSKITYFIPVVNVITAFAIRNKVYEQYYEELQDYLIPMTDEEYTIFKNTDDLVTKLSLVDGSSDNNTNSMENISIIAKKVLVIDNDKVVPMSYTYDEVKRISSVYPNTYKIVFGNSEGRNVAIIGLEKNLDFDLVSYRCENRDYKYEFNKYSEEEAMDKKYLIYPFHMIDSFEQKIDPIVDEIRNSRHYRICYPTTVSYNLTNPKKLVRKK